MFAEFERAIVASVSAPASPELAARASISAAREVGTGVSVVQRVKAAG